jgi:hypothetical protein
LHISPHGLKSLQTFEWDTKSEGFALQKYHIPQNRTIPLEAGLFNFLYTRFMSDWLALTPHKSLRAPHPGHRSHQ